LSDIVDGANSTILLIETNHEPGPWIAGGRPTVRGLELNAAPHLGSDGQFGGLHVTCPAVMADASVRQLSNETDASVLAAMMTIAGRH
jgi:hypothetical protein